MEQGEYKRKYLSISSISMLGACETKFMEAIEGRKKQTRAMKAGSVAHEKVAEALPKITKEDIIREIKVMHPIQVRELPVYDEKTHICGRIDQLHMTGFTEKGKNTGIVIDDKYPSSPRWIQGLTPTYKIQLSAYAVALENSDNYGGICKVVGAQLRYLQKQSNAILQQYNIDSNTLDTYMSNTIPAIDDAWNMYKGKQQPEHRSYDVESGAWVGCLCPGQDGCLQKQQSI